MLPPARHNCIHHRRCRSSCAQTHPGCAGAGREGAHRVPIDVGADYRVPGIKLPSASPFSKGAPAHQVAVAGAVHEHPRLDREETAFAWRRSTLPGPPSRRRCCVWKAKRTPFRDHLVVGALSTSAWMPGWRADCRAGCPASAAHLPEAVIHLMTDASGEEMNAVTKLHKAGTRPAVPIRQTCAPWPEDRAALARGGDGRGDASRTAARYGHHLVSHRIRREDQLVVGHATHSCASADDDDELVGGAGSTRGVDGVAQTCRRIARGTRNRALRGVENAARRVDDRPVPASRPLVRRCTPWAPACTRKGITTMARTARVIGWVAPITSARLPCEFLFRARRPLLVGASIRADRRSCRSRALGFECGRTSPDPSCQERLRSRPYEG